MFKIFIVEDDPLIAGLYEKAFKANGYEAETAFDGKELDEDGKFKTKEQIQKEVDELNGNMEKVLENKIREINE